METALVDVGDSRSDGDFVELGDQVTGDASDTELVESPDRKQVAQHEEIESSFQEQEQLDPPGFNPTAEEEEIVGWSERSGPNENQRKEPLSSQSIRERKRFLEEQVARRRRFRTQNGVSPSEHGSSNTSSYSTALGSSSWVPYKRRSHMDDDDDKGEPSSWRAPGRAATSTNSRSWRTHVGNFDEMIPRSSHDRWVPLQYYRKDIRSPPARYRSSSPKATTESPNPVPLPTTESNSIMGSSRMLPQHKSQYVRKPQEVQTHAISTSDDDVGYSELGTITSVSESAKEVLLSVDFHKDGMVESQLSSDYYEEFSIASSQVPSDGSSSAFVAAEYDYISVDDDDSSGERRDIRDYEMRMSSASHSEYTEKLEEEDGPSRRVDPPSTSSYFESFVSVDDSYAASSVEHEHRIQRSIGDRPSSSSSVSNQNTENPESYTINSQSSSKNNPSKSNNSSSSSSRVYIVPTNDCLDIRCYERRPDGSRGTNCKPTCGMYTVISLAIVLALVWIGNIVGLVRIKE